MASVSLWRGIRAGRTGSAASERVEHHLDEGWGRCIHAGVGRIEIEGTGLLGKSMRPIHEQLHVPIVLCGRG